MKREIKNTLLNSLKVNHILNN